MLQRLRSAIYGAPDLARAKTFYSLLLDQKPYFDETFYVGFDVAGFELGLDPNAPVVAAPVAYWRVASLKPVIARALELGATVVAEPHEVGGGLSMAVLADPNGNHLGLIHEQEKP